MFTQQCVQVNCHGSATAGLRSTFYGILLMFIVLHPCWSSQSFHASSDSLATNGAMQICFEWLCNNKCTESKQSNVTGRHKGPKRKLWAGVACVAHLPVCGDPWWVLLQHTLLCCDVFSSSSVVSHAFSALFEYLKFGHHPHPLGYLCANFFLSWPPLWS